MKDKEDYWIMLIAGVMLIILVYWMVHNMGN